MESPQLPLYSLAIMTYALHVISSPFGDSAYKLLMTRANKTEQFTWWGTSDKDLNKSSEDAKESHNCLPKSNDVETSAYALLTLVKRNEMTEALPIVKWLISQQNSNGGFSSTQDTVIGIQSLGRLASQLSTKSLSMNLEFSYENTSNSPDEPMSTSLQITNENSMVLQKFELPGGARVVQLVASGSGAAIVQVSWQYNLTEATMKPAFFLEPVVASESNKNYLKLIVSTS